VRSVISILAMISIVVLVTACGASDPSVGNASETPMATATDGTSSITVDGATPTATADGTQAAVSNATTATASTPTAQPASAPVPTTPPVSRSTTAPTPVPTTPPAPKPTTAPTPTPAPASKTVTVWIQATDSCMEAIPGAQFIVNGPGAANQVTGTTPGTLPRGVPTYISGHCPVDRGSCVSSTIGCVSVALDVPTSGTATYKITPKTISVAGYLGGIAVMVPKQYLGQGAYSKNYSYVQCEGGSDCAHGPEVATVQVTSSGSVSATTQNVNPDGFVDAPWPSSGAFTGAQGDPIMFHLFGASAPNDFSMVCNEAINAGDTVSKDPMEMHMTGTPTWPHCRSGR
jgi:hypothetical protein